MRLATAKRLSNPERTPNPISDPPVRMLSGIEVRLLSAQLRNRARTRKPAQLAPETAQRLASWLDGILEEIGW